MLHGNPSGSGKGSAASAANRTREQQSGPPRSGADFHPTGGKQLLRTPIPRRDTLPSRSESARDVGSDEEVSGFTEGQTQGEDEAFHSDFTGAYRTSPIGGAGSSAADAVTLSTVGPLPPPPTPATPNPEECRGQ